MIIGSRRRYVGLPHPGLRGLLVEIVAVHRRSGECEDYAILASDEEIGEILPTDWVEVAPIIRENGTERRSWVTSDAAPSELRAAD